MGAFKKVALVALGVAAAYGVMRFIKDGMCNCTSMCGEAEAEDGCSGCNGSTCDGSSCKHNHTIDIENCKESAVAMANNLKKYTKEMHDNYNNFVKTHSAVAEKQANETEDNGNTVDNIANDIEGMEAPLEDTLEEPLADDEDEDDTEC